jgi:hypothetical protein
MVSRTARRRFLTTKKIAFFIACLSCSAWIYIVFFISPIRWEKIYYAPFFIVTYIAISSVLAFIISSKAVVIAIPLGLIAILFLRILGIRDWFNPLLITGLVITIIYFFTAKEDNDKLSQETSIKQSKTSAHK